MIQLNDYEAYCFDLDGTIYLGDHLLPGECKIFCVNRNALNNVHRKRKTLSVE